MYLEKVPGFDTGCVKWHFDFGCCGLLVDEVTLRLSCVEDFGGEVVVILAGHPGQQRVRYPAGESLIKPLTLLTIILDLESKQVVRKMV